MNRFRQLYKKIKHYLSDWSHDVHPDSISLWPCLNKPSLGVRNKVEGDYERTSPLSSNNRHFVTIRATPGSDNVFTWRNKEGDQGELLFVKAEENGAVLVFLQASGTLKLFHIKTVHKWLLCAGGGSTARLHNSSAFCHRQDWNWRTWWDVYKAKFRWFY